MNNADILLLSDIMSTPVETVSPDCLLAAALVQLRQLGKSSLVVCADGKPVGMLTERDIVAVALENRDPANTPVSAVMGKKLVTARPNAEYRDAYRMLADAKTRHLVVVDAADRLVGIASETDFLNHLAVQFLVRLKEVGAVMTQAVVTLPEDASVGDAARMMAREKISCVVIESQARAVGIFTERDVVALLHAQPDITHIPLQSVMTKPVHTVTSATLLTDATQRMRELGVRRLVVTDSKQLIVGVISRHDLVHQLYDRHVEQMLAQLGEQERELDSIRSELRVERELRRIQQLLAHSQRLAHIGSFDVDLDSLTTIWSDECYRILGYDPASASASLDAIVARTHPADRARVMQAYAALGDAQGTDDMEFRIEHPDYDTRILHQRFERETDADSGRVTRVVGMIQDITLRETAQRENKALNSMLVALTEGSADAIFVKDKSGAYLTANAALCQLLDMPRERLLGSSDSELFPPDAAARIQQDDQRIMAKGETEVYQEEIILNGHALPYLTTKGPLLIDGEVRGVFGIARDITALKSAEHELRDKEAFITKALDASQTGIYIIDLERDRFELINARLADLLGWPRDDVTNLAVDRLIEGTHPDDRERLKHHLVDVQSTAEGAVMEIEFRYRLTPGNWRWLRSWDAVFERSPDGRARRLVGTLLDVTSRTLAESALRDSEQRFRAIFDATYQFVGLMSPDGVLLEANDSALSFAGIDPVDAIGRPFWEARWWAGDKRRVRQLKDAIKQAAKGEFVRYTVDIQGADQAETIDFSLKPMLDDFGHVTMIIPEGRIITQQKRVERELRENQERLRVAQSAGRVGTWHYDPTTTLFSVSEEFQRCAHLDRPTYPIAELIDRLPADDARQFREVLDRSFCDEQPFEIEHRILTDGDGKVCWIDLRGKVQGGRHRQGSSLVGTAQDITERKLAELALRKSESRLHALTAKLQAVREEERTRLSREVHDGLGQLLTALSMDLAWTSRRAAKIDDSDLREAIQNKLAEAADQTDGMISTVQEITSELRPSALDNLGLGAALEFETKRFQERSGIACSIRVPGDLPGIDPDRATAVFRILQELLTNVVRHAGATAVSVDLREDAGHLALEVIDNGKGISFVDLVSPDSLGLTGIRERASQLGGDVDFERIPQGGTRVRLGLP